MMKKCVVLSIVLAACGQDYTPPRENAACVFARTIAKNAECTSAYESDSTFDAAYVTIGNTIYWFTAWRNEKPTWEALTKVVPVPAENPAPQGPSSFAPRTKP